MPIAPFQETCTKYDVNPGVLTLHSDRGSPMTAKYTVQLLADLGVTRTLSRPHVSDYNPFSEAQFKTLKYHAEFPGRFDDITHAQRHCRTFFPWYNHAYRHGGIAMLTPADVHFGHADDRLRDRQRVLADAWRAKPERFVLGRPSPAPVPDAVWINPPEQPTEGGLAQ